MCPSPVKSVSLDSCSLTLQGNDVHLCFELAGDKFRDTFTLDDRSMGELGRIARGLPGSVVDSRTSPVTIDDVPVRGWAHTGFTVSPPIQISNVQLSIEGTRIILSKDGARVFAQIDAEPARVMREQIALEKACVG
jgi:hypothetical protein